MLKLMEAATKANFTFTYKNGGFITDGYRVWINNDDVYDVEDADGNLITFTHSVDEVISILGR